MLKKFISLSIISFFIPSLTFAQLYSFSVNVNGIPSDKMVRAYKTNATMICVDDLFSILNIQHNFNSEILREEVKLNEGTLHITAFNPFLSIKSYDGRITTFQMYKETDFKYGKIFVPLNGLTELLNKFTSINIKSDEKSQIIFIKYDPKSIPKDITQNIQQRSPEPGPSPDKKTFNPAIKKPENESETNKTISLKFDLFDYKIEEKSNGYIFRIKSRKSIKSVSKNLSGNTLYLRIPKSSIDIDRFNQLIDNGLIKSIHSQQNKENADLKIIFNYQIQGHEILSETKTNDVLLLLRVSPDVIKKIKTEREKKKQLQKKNPFDVIVIDAGHGGIDPGAIGYRGTKEKDVNLGIARKLGKLIEKNHKDIKVIYTRKDDKFVELYRRGQIANENNGKLFISIHCNSTDERPGQKKGYEVYLLRPGRTEEAIRIAERENSVIKYEEGYQERYKHLSDENFILTAMASTANVKHSEKFASILAEKMSKTLPIKNNGVKQAGFYVLVGASMPSVLIETGYINHPDDEMFLRSESGQQLIAEAIYKAIIEYKNYYEELASK